MSRCFRFPPPGYVKQGALGYGPDESIKLLRNTEVKKESRIEKERKIREKERKSREDKERRKKERRERKEKKKQKLNEAIPGCPKKARFDGQDFSKEAESEAEPLERSGITEEHGQPMSSENLSYISDSTQNKKRKGNDFSPIEIQSQGKSTFRIKFTLKKPRGNEAAPDTEHLCSTSGAKDLAQSEHGGLRQAPLETGTSACDKLPSLSHYSSRSSGQCKSEDRSIESLYRTLVEDWVPLPICAEQDYDDDQEWLFGPRRQGLNRDKRGRDGDLGCRSLASWPQAKWLREADIYALPYTIPF